MSHGRRAEKVDPKHSELSIVRQCELLMISRSLYYYDPQGYNIGRKRIRRLMRKMGISAIYQTPRTSKPHPEHKIYPYLLRNVSITRPDHAWCADITYIPMRRGYLYLVAIMDWASRSVLAWRLSNSMDPSFCVEALEEAIARYGKPEIFNTDQGSQLTSYEFTRMLQDHGIAISMDGKGRYGQRLHRAAVALPQVRVRVSV